MADERRSSMRYQVHCGRLKSNGLRFYTQHDNGSAKEMAVICIMAGSFYDPLNRRGLGHLVEHAICNETKDQNEREIFSLYNRTMGGPDDNRYITIDREVTTFGPGGTIRKIHNRKLFHVFSSMMQNPTISREMFKSERAAVFAEHYLQGKDVVENRVFDMFYKSIFPKLFRARDPMDGYMGEVRRATLKDVKNYIERYYVPANAFVVFFGPKHEEVRQIIARELGEWGVNTKKNRNKGHQSFVGLRRGGFHRLTESRTRIVAAPGICQYHVTVGFPTETYCSKDAEGLDVLAQILSDRMYYRLRVQNYEWKKGIYRTPVYTERSFAHGLFMFHFATLDQSASREGINVFLEECKKLCTELVTCDEVEAWVGYMYDYEYIDIFQNVSPELTEKVVMAVASGDVNLKGLHARGKKLQSFLKKGGRQKLREVARKYFSGHSATVIFRPK